MMHLLVVWLRSRLVAGLAVACVLALLGPWAWTLFQLYECEAHDRCEEAPAWVGEGLHELQRMDGGCVYLPEGCDGGRS